MPIEMKCYGCVWLRKFESKRDDEPSDYGCRKPGYEGYTNPENPDCAGAFYSEKPTSEWRDF